MPCIRVHVNPYQLQSYVHQCCFCFSCVCVFHSDRFCFFSIKFHHFTWPALSVSTCTQQPLHIVLYLLKNLSIHSNHSHTQQPPIVIITLWGPGAAQQTLLRKL